MEKEVEDDSSFKCLSFSCYSSNSLADIAIRVAAEDSNNNEDQDFEFALVHDEKDTLFDEVSQKGTMYPVFNRKLTINGDEKERSESCMMVPLGKLLMEEILSDEKSQKGPIFPVLNRNLMIYGEKERSESRIMVPLGKLLMEDREEHGSCSSSDEDELGNVPEGTYSVWRPKKAETTQPHPPSMCKKSKSTGSASRRWKFPDFMKRSNSEGKNSFFFLTPKQRVRRVPEKETPIKIAANGKGKVPTVSVEKRFSSAHEALYVRNRAVKEGNKKKSYLPYRQGLVDLAVYQRFIW